MEVDVFKGAKCIFHKNYDIAFNPGRKRTTGDIDAAAAMAMNMMAESLSEATREITENLAQELNFLIIGSERAQK